MPNPGKVSQTQIARDLGVSQALVSLALNGRKAGINAETYQRIWDRAAELGYAPKGMHLAAALANRGGRQVGYILRSPLRLYTQSNFFSHVQHGLHAALEAAGCDAIFLGAEDELRKRKQGRSPQLDRTLLGVVLLGEVDLKFLHQLRAVHRRVVAVSAHFPGFCHSVNSNEQQAVDLLVDHLVEAGHARIGWFGGNAGLGRHEQRQNALRNALQLRGLPVLEDFWFVDKQADRREGAAMARRFLDAADRPDRPTAIVCHNGVMARGAVNAFHQAGHAVPDTVSVVAIDRTRVLTEEHPVITGAGAIPEKLGEAAARLIIESTGLEDESFTDLVLPAQLLVGESSARPAREAAEKGVR